MKTANCDNSARLFQFQQLIEPPDNLMQLFNPRK